MSNEYRDIMGSLLRFAADFASAHSLTAINLDAFANPTEWPAGDFIGVAETELDTDMPLQSVSLAFVISTRDDVNLMRMGILMNALTDLLKPSMTMPIYDLDTGAPRGRLAVSNGTRVGKVVRTESQPARPFFLTLQSNQAVRL
jgi:hypothetical protein